MGGRGVLGATALLVIGAVAGIAVDRTLIQPAATGHVGGGAHGSLIASLRNELDLDANQLDTVQAIMRHHQQQVNHTWAVIRPAMQATVDSVERQIAEVLRPEQRDRFHAWFARHHPQE